jgi:hypothetical protein
VNVYDAILKINAALVAAGWPALSRWWRRVLKAFYRSKRRRLVLRVGRRGGKSTALCLIAVAEAVFGAHAVPPGDIGCAVFVSASKEEARARLKTRGRGESSAGRARATSITW